MRRAAGVGSWLLVAATTPAHADAWFALGRHGECVPLEQAMRRDDALRGTRTPDEIRTRLTASGAAFTLEPMKDGPPGLLRFDYPQRAWAMLLGTAAHCRDGAAR